MRLFPGPVKILFTLFLLLAAGRSVAQNLLPNGEFKQINKCCEYNISCAPMGWWTTSAATFNFEKMTFDKKGQPVPKPAPFIAMNVQFPNNRTYIQAPLLCPLQKGRVYTLSICVQPKTHALRSLGVYFSDSFLVIEKKEIIVVGKEGTFKRYSLDSLLPFTPQIVLENKGELLGNSRRWIRLQADYVATGTEKFLVAGNFLPDTAQDPVVVKKGTYGPEHPMLYYVHKIMLTDAAATESCDITGQLEILDEINRRHTYFGRCEDELPVDMDHLFTADEGWNTRYATENSRETVLPELVEPEKIYRLNNVLFEFDKTVLLPVSFVELDNLVALLETMRTYGVEIRGHTDSLGSPAYNLQLSTGRARAVADYLQQHGILAERITYQGFGATLPVAGNDNEEGRQLNRRVEFVLKAGNH